LTLTNAEIIKKLEGMDQEAKTIKKRIFETCWFMRGGITLSEIMQLSVSDIPIMNDVIEGNLETTKKTGMPFF
jgi:hypothetical protein|tara:strand:- start:863 stop:1081 length:219 start_codon:yes stop_codon:yes gene_type:complete